MILSGGQCSRTAEKFGASGDESSSLSACFSRLRFRSHWLQSVGKEWEGEAPAEPKTAASSEWRIANGEQRVASGE